MIRKTTLREIKQSLGRYIAIMAIIALGVGIFAGLKASKPAMHATTQQYLQKLQFYDYRLISTIGFDAEDAAYFQEQEGVRNAEGAYTYDIMIVSEDGNEMVIKAHSLSENINMVSLSAGRLPENDTECVVDANLFSESRIGDKVSLAKSNDEDDLDVFKYQEYTIVGTVQSSLYIQFERGNSSLGNGTVAGFMYLLPEGFDSEYYTELFVKFTDDFDLYSEEYDAFLEEKNVVWEDLLQNRILDNFNEIVSDAEREIADAEAELEREKADALKELEDAKKELEDAYQELTDAEKEIADGEQEILDGKQELLDGKQEIEDARKEIAENEKKLNEAEAEFASQEQTFLEKEQELNDAISQYNSTKSQLEKQKKDANAQEQELLAQIEQIEQGLALLETQTANLNQMEAELNQAILLGLKSETDEDVILARAQIQAGREEIGAKEQTAQETQLVLNGYLEQVKAGKSWIASAEVELHFAYMEITEATAQLEDGRKQLEDAKLEIADGRTQIKDANKDLDKAQKELEQAESDLEQAEKDLAEAKTELADGWSEYNDGWKEYEEGLAEFEEEIGDAETEIADAKQELADLEQPSTYVLGRDTNVGYVCFESDSSIVEGIADIFPMFFFLVAALVCMTTMNRMIEEQRTQIGVLKALGYSDWTIMNKYLFYSGSAAFTGCVIGFFAGTYFLPKIIWFAYEIMYDIEPLEYLFDAPMAILCLAASLLCSVGTTWLSCKNELSEVSAQLMRPKAPKAGKRVWLEHIPFVWNRLKFLHKVSIRNIFRYKKRFFMMIVGISGCTALLVVGFGIRDSITSIAAQQYDEIQTYDIGVVFNESISEEKEQEFVDAVAGLVDEYSYAAEISVDFGVETQTKGVNLIILKEPDKMGNYINLHTKAGEAVSYPDKGEVVICRKLSEIFDLNIGDSIYLQDEDMNRMEVKVSGICENFIMNYVYINQETYEESIGESPVYKSFFVNLKDGVEAHEASAKMMSVSGVSSVTVNADMQERFASMMGSLDYIVYTIIVCAAALAFIVLYNLTNINITERIREIATIKVLGFYKNETASYVFRENTVLSLIGDVVGLGLGYILHRFVMSKIVVDMVSFDVQIKPVSYVISFLLTILFSWLINRLMSGKLEKINMAESLKSVD